MADLASQFQEAMQNLQDKVAKGEILKEAVVKAVQPLVRAAAASAPRGTGKLSGSMTTQSFVKSDEVTVRVGPGRPEGSHGILLEFGTIYMTARPFLASAYAATQQEIADQMGIALADLIL